MKNKFGIRKVFNMRKMIKRIAAATLAAAMILPMETQAYPGDDSGTVVTVEEHTQQEIAEKFYSLGLDEEWIVKYDEEPVITAPYSVGKLSDETLQQALNMTNFIRYTAGLPEVELDDDYNYLAQCASTVNAANDRMTHYPEQPYGMNDELYGLCELGARSSNLAWGYSTIPDSILAYMDDHTESSVGHRRWILYPSLGKVGFGYAGNQTAMHVIDREYKTNYNVDYVTWPPNNMPMELYNIKISMISLFGLNSYPFSVSFDSNYDVSSLYQAVVHVKCETDGREWTISQEQQSEDTSFCVNTQGAGTPACIIFRMVGRFQSGDKVSVNITGLTKNGEPADISYEVNFFDIQTDLEDCSISSIKAQTYTGRALKPEPVIKYNGVKLTRNVDYILEYENNKTPGKAKIIIEGKGKFTGKSEVTFYIKPKKQTIRKISAGDSRFEVDWINQPGKVSYEVQYSTEPSMKNAKTKTFSGTIYNKSIWVEPGKKYYVRVRSFIYSNGYYGKKIYGAWSKVKAVKIK